MKKLPKVLLILAPSLVIPLAAVFPLTGPSYRVGMKKDKVMEDLHAQVIVQNNRRLQKKPLFQRVWASSSSELLEISIDYQLRRNHVFLTHWETCKVDSNGFIIDVQSDWVWKGFP